jgi:hypothetical protein
LSIGQGSRQGQGRGMGRGVEQGRMAGKRSGAGPGGYCICPHCAEKLVHQVGMPCYSAKCPKCGAAMVRE